MSAKNGEYLPLAIIKHILLLEYLYAQDICSSHLSTLYCSFSLPWFLTSKALTMPAWLPSVPYQVPGHGYWDPVTSTLEWCEEVSTSPISLSQQVIEMRAIGLLCNPIRRRNSQHYHQCLVPFFRIPRPPKLPQIWP